MNGHRVLYFSSARAGGFAPDGAVPDSDIYMSVDFGPAELVPGLNTAAEDSRPNMRHDGLEIVFDSTRDGTLGGPDIWTASRDSRCGDWSAPAHLAAPINSAASETRASLSWEGSQLVFGSTRPSSEPSPAGPPSNDVYLTVRQHSGVKVVASRGTAAAREESRPSPGAQLLAELARTYGLRPAAATSTLAQSDPAPWREKPGIGTVARCSSM